MNEKGLIHKKLLCKLNMMHIKLDEENSKTLKRTERQVWLERNGCLQVYLFLAVPLFNVPPIFSLEFDRKMLKFTRKGRNGRGEQQ